MIKSTIKILSNTTITNNITKRLLYSNNLLDDNQFIKELFVIYCNNSNIEMVNYICSNNSILSNGLFDSLYYNELFNQMCKNSNYQIIKWYYEKFTQQIDLSNLINIINSITNYDTTIFRYILSISKNFYSQNQYETIFLCCVKNFYIYFIRILFEEYPNINLKILNGVELYNSIDIYTPNSMVNFLREKGDEQNYQIKITVNNTLEVNKKIIINKINNIFMDKLKILKINLEPVECVICLTKYSDVITNCGHKFCFDCIKSWCNKNFSCPTCRNSESTIKFYSLV